eukprot:gene37511-50637_t
MIKRGSGGKYHDNSGHLAVMTKDFNLALVERLKVYDPTFGAAKTFPQSTPLHLAAYYSNNVAVIEELIRAYPLALEMKNLGLTEGNNGSRHIVNAAPHSALKIDDNGRSALHYCLQYSRNANALKEKMVSILLEAFPNDVDNPDVNGLLPIHYAAEYCETNILQLIVEANPEHLAVTTNCQSIAHIAV